MPPWSDGTEGCYDIVVVTGQRKLTGINPDLRVGRPEDVNQRKRDESTDSHAPGQIQ